MADPAGYLLDRESIETLRREVSALRHRVRNLGVRTRHVHRNIPSITDALEPYLAMSTTEITAADWTADPPLLGCGVVQPFDLDKAFLQSDGIARIKCIDGEALDLEVWYNIAPIAIEAGRGLVGHDWQNIVLITVETCDPLNIVCEGIE